MSEQENLDRLARRIAIQMPNKIEAVDEVVGVVIEYARIAAIRDALSWLDEHGHHFAHPTESDDE